MKRMTRQIALLLALVMVFSAIPFTAAAEELPQDGTITGVGCSLSLEGAIHINQYVSVTGFPNVDVAENGGLLIFKSPVSQDEATYENADIVCAGLTEVDGNYVQQTPGIPAKEYADELYLCVYVQDQYGRYVYSPVTPYSVQIYCESRLENSENEDMKNLAAAMLHYGTAAQNYFGYHTDDLANANICDAWPTEELDASLLTPLKDFAADVAATGDVTVVGKSLSLEGAILVNYFFEPVGFEAAEAELLVWDGVSEELTLDNVSYTAELAEYRGEWWGSSRQFAAKELGKTIFACARLTDAEGNAHYSDVIAYSPEVYAANRIRKSTNPNMVTLAEKMVIYGEYAAVYFGVSENQPSEEPEEEPETEKVEVSADVEVENGTVKDTVSMEIDTVKATVPGGVAVEDGTSTLTLSVQGMNKTTGDITVGETEERTSLDIHVEGVSADNTTAIVVELGAILAPGLNKGNVALYHVENGVTNAMTRVDNETELDAHNEFYYDPVTGEVSVAMATFSEVAVVADTTKPWNGEFDDSWYKNGEPYVIANADQLAAFGAIVGGMNGQTQNSFTGKTIKLIADINLGDKDNANESLIFHPIGYYYTEDKNADGTTGDLYSTVCSFEGVFDGNGHTIANFYQNTWEIKGDYSGNYYSDAMGLFGYVVGGTVQNLTVDSFSSDGEFTPTGVIAAYAAGSAEFTNIAITNCNPRVYNTGNGGIIGVAGNSTGGDAITLQNITVDNSNKISALWGSWDVACGGLVGMFRGNAAEENPSTISFTNCHVSAQIDVNNDVCANYQYYAYRYAGMIIGSVRSNEEKDGKVLPNMANITATGCTVNYGDWNDYYYCELVHNTIASYTHDHQFSRLTKVDTLPESATGTAHYYVKNEDGTITCRHFINGALHTHDMSGTETVGEDTVAVEDKTCVYLPFHQLFTGYGWGVNSVGLEKYSGIVTDLDISEGDQEESVEKFESKFTGDFLYRVGNKNAVSVGSLFKEKAGNESIAINAASVYVTIDSVDENADVSGTYTAVTSDWTQGTIQFSGTGVVKVTIQDYQFCEPTVLYLEVVDATNVTQYSELKEQNSVFLGDITMSSGGTYRLTGNKVLYGNGFTFDVTAGAYAGVEYDYASYVIYLENSNLDNVQIKGAVYPEVGSTKTDSYYRAIIMTGGNCKISNSFISNGASPIRNGGNLELINTTLKGGAYANLDLRNGHLILDNVTTVNQIGANDKYNDTTEIVGMGIVVYQEGGSENLKITIRNGFTQYNYLSETQADELFTDTYSSAIKNVVFGDKFTDYQNNGWINFGIISMNNYFAEGDLVDERTDKAGYFGTEKNITLYGVSKNCYVYSIKPADTEAPNYPAYTTAGQGVIVPVPSFDFVTKNYVAKTESSNDYCYADSGVVYISMDEGDTFTWDTSILNATKCGNTLDYTVTMAGVDYTGNSITFNESGTHTVVYAYNDPYNYRLGENGGIAKFEQSYTQVLTIQVSVVKQTAKNAEFGFGANGTAYSAKTILIGDKTYVMPDVTATVSGKIGSTTVSGTTVYYPITEMYTSDGVTAHKGSWYACFPIFKDAVQIIDYADQGTGDPVTYNQTKVTTVAGIPSTLKATNPTSAFLYSMNATNYPPPTDPTAVSGAVCYTCNRSGLTASNERNEMTIIAEYTYTDNAGKVYYYYVGYHCAAQTNGCVTPDTLITLADGSQVRVDTLTGDEELLVWNMETGMLDSAPIMFVDSDPEAEVQVIHLCFSDGTEVKAIYEHGFWDYDLNRYVYLDSSAAEYIGHTFAKQNGDTLEKVQLTDVVVETERTTAWSPVTVEHLCYFVNGMLSMPGGVGGLFNIFEVDPETMTYDQDALARDIETYGLFTYEELNAIEPLSEEMFEAAGGAYLKISMGKGNLTMEELQNMIRRYSKFF